MRSSIPGFKHYKLLRILYINPSPVPPSTDAAMNRFSMLLPDVEGDVLQPVWFAGSTELEDFLSEPVNPCFRSGKFRFFFSYSRGRRGSKTRKDTYRFFIAQALKLHRECKYDAIVVYAHQTTGLIGVVLRILTGAPLIVEVMTSPALVNITERNKPTISDRLKKTYSDVCLHISVLCSRRVHLLYDDQLKGYPLLSRKARSVFHDFVTTSQVGTSDEESEAPFILLVGAPWYLKGADRAVEAFRMIAEEFPSVRLLIQGHFPDVAELKRLTDDMTRVSVLKAAPHKETFARMRRASVVVLPSRCEGLPRVLIEAMACGVPIVASDVGGIPSLVRDGIDGYVVPNGDVKQIADRLRLLLSDQELRARMGRSGKERANEVYSEVAYASAFSRMIFDATSGVRRGS